MPTMVAETTVGNNAENRTQIELPDRLTVRRLLQLYIDDHVEAELHSRTNTFFLPAPEEAELNSKTEKTIDRTKLYDQACKGFSSNQDEISLHPESNVKFQRLTPLVGG